MQEFLVFRLYGPLAAWGDTAVGVYRPSDTHPSRSAVLGLLTGALGVKRADETVHRALDAGYGMATLVHATGLLLRDYHTIQSSSARRGRRYYTRKDELASNDVSAILSQRDYRCDALADIAVWPKNTNAPYSLEDIQQALRRPAFVPYLGRKSCPPALPMQPQCIMADDFLKAFERAEFSLDDYLQETIPRVDPHTSVYWEGDPNTPLKALQTVARRDRPLSRTRWQFIGRDEHFATLPREN